MPEELALLGGPRTVPPGSVKPWPIITEASYTALSDVLDSGVFHTLSGPQCQALMEEFAEFCGVEHAVVTNSGTSALHVCVAAAGLEPGDEVILPAHTYWATAAACLHGLTIPVFVDIDPVSYTLDPAKIEAALTERTKAIMPVHMYGMPADVEGINAVAKRHGLVVLADACQAGGAEYKGRKTGGLFDAEGFSLNRSKTISGCEGGVYCTNNDDFADYARNMTSFSVRQIGEPATMRTALGWMYRPLEFFCAFTREQLGRAPDTLQGRRDRAAFLTEELRAVPGLAGPATPPGRNPCYFTYVVTLVQHEVEGAGDLDEVEFVKRALAALQAEGIPLGALPTVPLPGNPVFQERQGFGRNYPWAIWDDWEERYVYDADAYPVTTQFLRTHCSLGGVFPPNTMELMQAYVDGMRKVMSRPQDWVHREVEG